jgi:excisionase family DNA binding protein
MTRRKPPRYDDLPDLCTVQEVGAYLQTSRNATYDLIARGEIPSVRFGRMIRVPKTSLPKGPDPAFRREMAQLRTVMKALRRHTKLSGNEG